MPHLLDPRIISLSKQTRAAYAHMVSAETLFCNHIGKVGFQHNDNRQKLIFASPSFKIGPAQRLLVQIEQAREEYQASAKEDEEASRARRKDVGFFDTITDQSTQPPRLITRAGSLPLTSANIEGLADRLEDRADFVKVSQTTAYRVGRLTLEEALREVAAYIQMQLDYIQNSEAASNYQRAEDQRRVLERHRETEATLQDIAARADAAGLHVRIRSGTGTRFRARFPGIEGGKWLTVPFTVANIAVISVAEERLRGMHRRTRETRYRRIAIAAHFEVFEEINPDDGNM